MSRLREVGHGQLRRRARDTRIFCRSSAARRQAHSSRPLPARGCGDQVVGVVSVGRRCWIALMMSEGNEPLFLQFKEAVQSVLEPYAGKSAYGHHGQRVAMGQRLMQPGPRIFSSDGLLIPTVTTSMCGSCTTPRSSLSWRLSTPKCCMSMRKLAAGRSPAPMQRRVKFPQRSAGTSVLQTTRSMRRWENLVGLRGSGRA
jgi:Uncharacterized protein conserved in bacteria (DUF2252)